MGQKQTHALQHTMRCELGYSITSSARASTCGQRQNPCETHCGRLTLLPRAARRLAPSKLLLLDTLDPDHAEAGVLTTDVRHIPTLFVFECFDRVHIAEL